MRIAGLVDAQLVKTLAINLFLVGGWPGPYRILLVTFGYDGIGV